jgi:uncharacterized protein (DUF433 family)
MKKLSITKYSIKRYSRFNKKTNKENKYSCVRISNKESFFQYFLYILCIPWFIRELGHWHWLWCYNLEIQRSVSMVRIRWQTYITIDPEIHHGGPCVNGTRVPVTVIVGSIADGMTMDQVLQEYPQLKQEDVRAALAYAAEAVHQDILLPLAG